MVGSVTNFSRNGLSDWLWQRVSAMVLLAYVVFLAGFFWVHPNLQFHQWHALFECTLFKVASLIVLVNFLAHAWIGLWTVFTDYIKSTGLRLVLQSVLVILLFAYVVWGVLILWGLM